MSVILKQIYQKISMHRQGSVYQEHADLSHKESSHSIYSRIA